jgi:uncharacterized membrane protein YfcA
VGASLRHNSWFSGWPNRIGRGALMEPILLIGFGVDSATVVATDLLFDTVTKLGASRVHGKNGLVDCPVVKKLWWGSIPATIIIVALAQAGILFANPECITTVLGVLVVIWGLSLLVGSRIQIFQTAQRIADPQHFKSMQPSGTIAV